jgi:outer membrane murein-binding lipoprotein Lpp
MEKFIHTPQTPVKSWDGLGSAEHQKILKKALKMRKNRLIVVAALASALALFSCNNKTVDEQVNDIIKDKQEVVDDLEEGIVKLTTKLQTANEELRKAKRLRK